MDNKKNNKEDWKLLLVCLVLWFLSTAMMNIAAPNGNAEVNDNTEISTEETEAEQVDEEPKMDSLFVEVYYQNATYKILRFIPTDIMYATANRGDLVMLRNKDDEPLTYDEFLESTKDLTLDISK